MNDAVLTDTTQFLTFTLAEEIFAVDIIKVQEVLEYTEMTRIPQMPTFMRGVINLRGHVVPVIDMRLKFGMPPAERTINTCIIILEVETEDQKLVLGAMGDSVREVMELAPDQIEPTPKIGANMRTDFIHGMGKNGDQFIIILDTDRIFSSGEINMLQTSEADREDMAA